MEKAGYIIVLQYKNALGKIVQKCHGEVFSDQAAAESQLAIMAQETKGVMLWIVEILVLEWKPKFSLVK